VGPRGDLYTRTRRRRAGGRSLSIDAVSRRAPQGPSRSHIRSDGEIPTPPPPPSADSGRQISLVKGLVHSVAQQATAT